jgi:hypothetical protein
VTDRPDLHVIYLLSRPYCKFWPLGDPYLEWACQLRSTKSVSSVAQHIQLNEKWRNRSDRISLFAESKYHDIELSNCSVWCLKPLRHRRARQATSQKARRSAKQQVPTTAPQELTFVVRRSLTHFSQLALITSSVLHCTGCIHSTRNDRSDLSNCRTTCHRDRIEIVGHSPI